MFFLTGRADALGKLGVSYAIGMVIGPFVGGLITKRYGEQSAAFFAATFSFISIIISLLFIPRNTKVLSQEEKSAEKLEASKLMNLVHPTCFVGKTFDFHSVTLLSRVLQSN